MGKLVYLVAGEHSGDTHGAELMGSLAGEAPDWRFAGLGGPRMRALSDGLVRDWVEEAAVVGLWEVLRRYGWFRRRFEETKEDIRRLRPDAVVLVDYPGFNLRLAEALRKEGFAGRIVDYISPQVWAWNKERIPRMAGWLDLMLCLFRFEKRIFEEAGLKTVWIGHPLVDQLDRDRVPGERSAGLVGLLPGSREREVARLFPVMLDAVDGLRDAGWHFEASAASAPLRVTMKHMVEKRGLQGVVEVHQHNSHSLMQRATCGVVASGTATLEATYYGMPYCLVYRVSWPTYLAARAMVDLDHIGMANILAGQEIIHEFIQGEANAGNVRAWVDDVMRDEARRASIANNLRRTARTLGQGGAAKRAAQAIIDLLGADE